MAGIIDVLRKYIRPYYYYILAIIILVIFLIASNYAYNKYYVSVNTPKASKFKDVANSTHKSKEAQVYFFHVDWCPHCKKALPDWNQFKSQIDGKEINGYQVKCIDLNCTDETGDVTAAINKYSIESYPTVKLVKDEQTIDFDSKITTTALEQFVNTML